MSWIKREDEKNGADKKAWSDSGMSWIKRDDENEKDKKAWSDSGMSWIKREDGGTRKRQKSLVRFRDVLDQKELG